MIKLNEGYRTQRAVRKFHESRERTQWRREGVDEWMLYDGRTRVANAFTWARRDGDTEDTYGVVIYPPGSESYYYTDASGRPARFSSIDDAKSTALENAPLAS